MILETFEAYHQCRECQAQIYIYMTEEEYDRDTSKYIRQVECARCGKIHDVSIDVQIVGYS